MSVCTCSPRRKRIASPRGFVFGSLSGRSGMPVEFENRTVTGVDARVTCGALVSEAAPLAGVNVPVNIAPFACAGRKPGCSPKILVNWSTRFVAKAISFSSLGSGIVLPPRTVCVTTNPIATPIARPRRTRRRRASSRAASNVLDTRSNRPAKPIRRRLDRMRDRFGRRPSTIPGSVARAPPLTLSTHRRFGYAALYARLNARLRLAHRRR
jgi:hypothetical protein